MDVFETYLSPSTTVEEEEAAIDDGIFGRVLTRTCVSSPTLGCMTGEGFLHPSDLLPFTRRPLFLIIDSDASSAFEVRRGPRNPVLRIHSGLPSTPSNTPPPLPLPRS